LFQRRTGSRGAGEVAVGIRPEVELVQRIRVETVLSRPANLFREPTGRADRLWRAVTDSDRIDGTWVHATGVARRRGRIGPAESRFHFRSFRDTRAGDNDYPGC